MNTLGRKILVASLVALLLFVGCSALIVRELGEWEEAVRQILLESQRAMLDGQFQAALTRAVGETASFVRTGEPDFAHEANRALGQAGEALAGVQRLTGAFEDGWPGKASHVDLLERQERVLAQVEGSVAATVSSTTRRPTPELFSLRGLYAHEEDSDRLWAAIGDHHASNRTAAERHVARHSLRVVTFVVASIGAFAAFIGLLFVYVKRRIASPLQELAESTARVAGGDLSMHVTITNRDEIGQLQESFNEMVAQLADQHREIRRMMHSLSEARGAAEAASRAKSDFLAKMSHEIRTPMNGVFVTLDLLHETSLTAEQRELVDLARSSARNLLGLVNEVLDLARIEAGGLRLESVVFDLHDLIGQTVELHGRRASAKGIEVRQWIAPDVPAAVRGDPLRLGQVLGNLLDNAIKFTDTGSIDVAVDPEPLPGGDLFGSGCIALRFRVRDTGVGVPPAQLERIFNPFHQADESTTRRYGGTGLGLAIVQQLVGMMGGEAGVESAPGEGSTFWFTVRLAAEGVQPAAAPPAEPKRPEIPPGRRVMLVEDNRDNREVMARMLARRGLAVTTAENGRAAVALAAAQPFDLILMDCQMPDMDGFEAARAIRAAGDGGHRVPIVALTAYSLQGQRERYLGAGMDDFVSKPYTTEQIEGVLHRWLVLEPAAGGPAAAGPGPDAAPEPRQDPS